MFFLPGVRNGEGMIAELQCSKIATKKRVATKRFFIFKTFDKRLRLNTREWRDEL